MRSVNGFNSRCLHIITGQDYRVTATAPEYDLLLAIRQRRLRYLGHILRMPESRVVRRALVALAKGGSVYPKGSLFMDCQTMKFHQLVALAQRRGAWNALATQLRWDGLPPYHWTPWVWDGTHTYTRTDAFSLIINLYVRFLTTAWHFGHSVVSNLVHASRSKSDVSALQSLVCMVLVISS